MREIEIENKPSKLPKYAPSPAVEIVGVMQDSDCVPHTTRRELHTTRKVSQKAKPNVLQVFDERRGRDLILGEQIEESEAMSRWWATGVDLTIVEDKCGVITSCRDWVDDRSHSSRWRKDDLAIQSRQWPIPNWPELPQPKE
jgi:hypothetical protein